MIMQILALGWLLSFPIDSFPNVYSLPFMTDNDCGLGIAVKSYLDELAASAEPKSENTRAMAKAKGPKEWLMFSENFEGDLEMAFRLWDAVSSSPSMYLLK